MLIKNHKIALLIIIIALGITFRIINLGNKIYWVDEVSTSLRIAGFTKQEIVQEISNQEFIDIKTLQKYQKINETKNFDDTWQALTRSPEHAPFYFILARIWTQYRDSSIVTIRMLSVLFSFLALPCLYWLSEELFPDSNVKWVAMCLLAVSPLYVAYAQEARPYSLWIVIILLSQIFLIRFLRSDSLINRFLYVITLILSLYTSLLSFLIVTGQVFYVFSLNRKKLITHLLMVGIAVLAFVPWLVIMFKNWQIMQDNTIWMNQSLNLLSMIIVWIYSVSTIFIETRLEPVLEPITILRIIVDFHLLILLIYSLYFIFHTTSKSIWLFFLAQLLVPILLLIAIDLCLGGQRSTAIRYLMPSYVLMHLALAYLFVSKTQKIWQKVLIIVILIQLGSCVFMLDKSPRYQKTRNLHNPAIAQIINQSKLPILLTEKENILDAISLSYLIEKGTKFKLINSQEKLDYLKDKQTVFILKPSLDLIKQIPEQNLAIEEVYQPKLLTKEEIHLSLWQLQHLPWESKTPNRPNQVRKTTLPTRSFALHYRYRK